jgi:type IV fimbrial biogenesis protein FimT
MKKSFLPKIKNQRIDRCNGLIGQLYKPHTFYLKSMGGFTLIEASICIALISTLVGFSISLFDRQISEIQLRRVVHAFIQDAQLSRQYSRQHSAEVVMRPLQTNNWVYGWHIQILDKSTPTNRITLKTYSLESEKLQGIVRIPEELLKASQQFTDISAQRSRHLTFNNGQMALLKNGGFVANQIIWQHARHPELVRHVILGPGGRWRICDPREDNQGCSSN